ncbi:MAG: putative 2-aminoethylphosphonate ABC transporter permease subunit [Cyanobacteriota bacterium]|nr:putative 2-aminoethylphosphonate ABC transporter permease subunit [Cyanobacteriota bacterium]
MVTRLTTPAGSPPPPLRVAAFSEVWVQRVLIGAVALWLLGVVILPLAEIVGRSLLNAEGEWVGLANYYTYFTTPGLSVSLSNTLWVTLSSTLISVILGLGFAYALTRTCMPGKGILRLVAMLPLYLPSLAQAIGLIYLFGNQGLISTGFFGWLPEWRIPLYGRIGIILGEVIYCFPQAVLILSTALLLADARLYEASIALRTSPWRTFWTVTLPGIRFGLVSAIFVCFTLVFTDFGVPKVVGGNFNVLATDIYKQVIGQQNLVMGATISVLMILPTGIAFIIDRLVQQRQVAMVGSRVVPLQPRPQPWLDWVSFAFCALLAGIILLVMAALLVASLVKVWPYQLSPSLRHYNLNAVAGGGYAAYGNSLRMSVYTAIAGTSIVFVSAYLVEKCRAWQPIRSLIYLASTLPVALPGLVLGLAYIFFFNTPDWGGIPNPLHGLYSTMALLVICNIVHFYTVGFLTASTALKQLDPEFEAVASSLKVPFYQTFWRVTLPLCLPAILQIGTFFFVQTMVTVSAVIFLYPPDLRLASVAVVNMDDAGNVASAAAMSTLIVLTSLAIQALYWAATQRLRRWSQAWQQR